MQKTRRAIVIHSPHSGRANKLAEAIRHLQACGVEIVESTSIASLDELAPQGNTWRENGIDVALAAGGDGVVGGVITHIAESGLPLGIIPLGTSNDIARTLNIPLDLAQAAAVIASGKEISMDVGEGQPAEQAPHQAISHPHGPVTSQVSRQKHAYFAHTLTVGLNVQFARLATNVATRQRFGRMTYPLAAVEVLTQHNPIDTTLTFEGLAHPQQATPQSPHPDEHLPLHCRALQVAVINAPLFGGRFQFTIPSASINDRLLDIIVFEEADVVRNIAATISHLIDPRQQVLPQNGQTGHHPADLSHLPGIHHIQAQQTRITTNADPQDMTLDGEVRGQTPAIVRVANEPLRILVPGS